MKKTIAFLFSAIMLLSLAGCAEKSGGNGSFSWQSNREQETATSYSVSPFLCTEPIETGNDEYITQQPLFADKEFFYFSQIHESVTGTEDAPQWSMENSLYKIPLQSGEPELICELGEYFSIYQIRRDSKEGFWFCGGGRNGFCLKQLDSAGNTLRETELDNALLSFVLDGQDRPYFLTEEEGEYVLAQLDETAEALTPVFSLAFEKLPGASRLSVAVDRLGQIVVLQETENGCRLCLIDGDKGIVREEKLFKDIVYDSIYDGTEEFDLYIKSGAKIMGYEWQSGEMTEVCDLAKAGFTDEYNLYFLPDGRITAADVYAGGFSLSLINRETVPADSLVTLKLAVTQDDPMEGESVFLLQDAVSAWNRQHADIKIEILDYTVYNTRINPTAGKLKLTTELIAGNCPDMYELGGMPASFGARDVFEDLNPYIDSDPEIDRAGLYDNILRAFERDGKLCELVPLFTIQTASGKKSLVGEGSGHSLAEYHGMMAEKGAEYLFSPGLSREAYLSCMLSFNMDSLIDWDSGTCRFDSELFRGILQSADAFREDAVTGQKEDDQRVWDYDETEMLSAGRQLLYMNSVGDVTASINQMNLLGEDFVFSGIPCQSGSGSAVKPVLEFVMSASSENKEECWQFLRQFLLDAPNGSYGFPLSREWVTETINNQMDNIREKKYYEDWGYSMEKLEAAFGRVNELIESTDVPFREDEAVCDIVREVSAAYFAGNKSLDETVKDIQARVGIYVAEQT